MPSTDRRGVRAHGREVIRESTQKEILAHVYQDALFKHHANPPLDKRIALPESVLAHFQPNEGVPTGPLWTKPTGVPAHVKEAQSDWAHPSQMRAGLGREPQIDKSVGAEQCYQHMNRWLNRGVMSPISRFFSRLYNRRRLLLTA